MDIYTAVKTLHISTAITSVALFSLRMSLSLRRPYNSLPRLLRIIPHVNDSALLITAICLALLSGQYPLQADWLSAKVAALLVYIGLGKIALKRAEGVRARFFWGMAALSCVSYIILVARSKSPVLGLF